MNKNSTKLILTLSLCIILIVLILPVILFLPSYTDFYNFNSGDKVNIASIINSIASPVITLVSVILLYITLQEQIKNNRSQQYKNDFEIIALQYNQLEIEFANLNFDYSITKTKGLQSTTTEISKKGYDAFSKICTMYKNNIKQFHQSYGADKIRSIILSFKLTDDLIRSFKFSNTQQLYDEKLKYFYEFKIRDALKQLCYALNKLENKTNATYILDFYIESEKRYFDPNFNLDNFKTELDLFK